MSHQPKNKGDALHIEGRSQPSAREEQGGALIASLLAAHRAPRGGGGDTGGAGDRPLLTDDELADIETTYADGISSAQIVDIFRSRGVRFSEATFRKYVQQGLLPRSRRIGRKGKHRGSMGVYPAKTVRRINAIKLLMADGYTIEEIEQQFLRFTDVIETLEEGIAEVFGCFAAEAENPRFDTKARKSLVKDIDEARKIADELLRRVSRISDRVSTSRRETHRSTGAAGSAEDLL